METRTRTLAKAVSWQLLGVVVMTGLAWVVTGSPSQSLGLAVTGSLVGFVSYFGHERVWQAVDWGRRSPEPSAGPPDARAPRAPGVDGGGSTA